MQGNLQKARGALWFTDALLWSLAPTKPLFGGSEERTAQALPGDQLWRKQHTMSLREGARLQGQLTHSRPRLAQGDGEVHQKQDALKNISNLDSGSLY